MPFDDDPIVYASGDAGVFGDMPMIAQLYSPELAIMTVGGKHNMGVREAALMRLDAVTPCDYDTFPDQVADIDDLERREREHSPRTEVLRMKPGETLGYP